MIKIINLIKNKMVFVKYLLASGFAFILDQLLFTILVLLLRNRVSIYIAVAVIISRGISSFFNYLLNRNKVFKANGKNKIDINTLFKYYILVVIQACVSAFLVGYLNSIVHVHKTFLYIPIETLIKIPVEIVLFIVNYFIQRLFIFNGSRVKIKINCSFFSALLALISTYSLTIQFTSKGTITDRFDSVLISLILCIALYKFYKIYKFEHKGETWFKALALIFSLLMILGYSYDKVGNASLVFGSYLTLLVSLIKLIGFYYLFDTIINCIYHLLCHYKIKDVIKNSMYYFTMLFTIYYSLLSGYNGL